MHGAMEICNSLQKNGFWADFIDPSTGKPVSWLKFIFCMYSDFSCLLGTRILSWLLMGCMQFWNASLDKYLNYFF